jgi:hypothetical protein
MKLVMGFLLIFCVNSVYPDRAAYSEKIRIRTESKNYLIEHFHDWSLETIHERSQMIVSEDQNPFDKNNNYAFIEAFSKETGKKVFHMPTPALTRLYISEDENYIVGISDIKTFNPYQLIIITMDGEIIKKRHISPQEAKMNKDDFDIFKNNFPQAFQFLQSHGRIYYIYPYYYIDFLSMNMPTFLGKDAFHVLLKYSSFNHLSNNFSSSVTNWVYWFNKENQNIQFNYRENKLFSISILDPNNLMIEISIDENI